MVMTSAANASEPVLLHAAGSLRGALTEVADAFATDSGIKVEARYGPSGTLRDEIAAGGSAQVFASANMEHPRSLAAAGKSSPVEMFARNRLCALVRPGLAVTPETLLEVMLRADIKLGTSTPKADPSGDYAFAVFARANAVRSGSRNILEQKAQQLTGGPSSATGPAGRSIYGWHVAEGRADIFLTYCTNALVAQRENPGQQTVALPEPLAVGADYGMTVMNGSPPAASRFARFIVSSKGQQILAKHGFSAPAPPQGERR
jgi:ABC-type molybdate transport system substrate-binding protein